MLLLKPSSEESGRSIVPPCGFLPLTRKRATLLSLRFGVLNTQKLAHMLDSLVRVSRRVKYDYFVTIANHATNRNTVLI